MATKIKVLCIRRLGWQSVANEFIRLGWHIGSAEEETTTTYTDHYNVYESGRREYTGTTTSSKVRIWLTMSRDRDWYVNGNKIIPIDILFSIVFLLRRIFAWLAPISSIPFIIVLLLGQAGNDEYKALWVLFLVVFFIWLGLRILESVLSHIGKRILLKGES
ncbi:MAG: hypothetical protein J5666_00465 [Bacilli bacterium]|nr:hypothetical protein [Bacilli bacterium]